MSIKNRVIPENIDVLVGSFGGCGSSFFTKFLAQYKTVNHNHTRNELKDLKHVDRPPLTLQQNLKAIYIFGDPYNAIYSMFRRKLQRNNSILFLSNYFINPIDVDCTLEQYLEEGIDRLKLGNAFENWSNSKVNYPIMLVKYEALWDHLPEIFDYLEIPRSEIKNFPNQKERNSNWQSLSQEAKHNLHQMYGELHYKIKDYDEIKIIEPNYSMYTYLPKYMLALGNKYIYKETKSLAKITLNLIPGLELNNFVKTTLNKLKQ